MRKPGRPPSKCREHVTKVGNGREGRWRCNHCGKKFAGGGSGTRIDAHLKWIKGKGIDFCQGYTNPFRPGLINPSHQEDPAIAGDSINSQTNPHGFFTLPRGDHQIVDANVGSSIHRQTDPHDSFNGLREMVECDHFADIINMLGVGGAGNEMVVGNTADSHNHQMNTESTSINLLAGSRGREISEINEVVDELTREEDDIKTQLQLLESRGKKRKSQVDDWLNEVQQLKNKAGRIKDSIDQLVDMTDMQQVDVPFLSIYNKSVDKLQKLTEKVRSNKEQKPVVLSTEFVGSSFEKNVREMLKLVRDERVSIIGIHGMGGVGKTCLATYMRNEIKARKTAFENVFWVTVSHDHSILKLQHDIAARMGLNLNGYDDEITRAENLSLELVKRGKSVIILDDVWEYIDLEKVGIPLSVIDIKLIVTTRLKHVCFQMDCLPGNIVTVLPLSKWSKNECLELFMMKLGQHNIPATLAPQVIEVADSVADECHGLPLGISVMARTMKGVNSIGQWRYELNQLRNKKMGQEMEQEVFKNLKRSYDNLKDKWIQDCFLHCALFSGYSYSRLQYLMSLADHGKINGRCLKEIFYEGHTVLNKLDSHSLSCDGGGGMNGMVRKMAFYVMKECPKYNMLECEREILDPKEWTAELELVLCYEKKEIPKSTSPYCPQLSTLILSNNYMRFIPESFFTQMNALTVLEISFNEELTSLPDSVSNLSSLVSLTLTQCPKMSKVPSLEKLQALLRLEISYTAVEQVLGLEMLTHLTWLDLSHNDDLRLITGGLHGLTNLQYLDLWRAGLVKVEVGDELDIQGLTNLECFRGIFVDCHSYNYYVRNGASTPKSYRLLLLAGLEDSLYEVEDEIDMIMLNNEYEEWQTVQFGNCEEESPHSHLLPSDLAQLRIDENSRWRSLCDALSSTNPLSSLTRIDVECCTLLESLFCISCNCSFCTNLLNLRSLSLRGLGSLSVICKEDDVGDRDRAQPPLSPNRVFSHLRTLKIDSCGRIVTLLSTAVWSQLHNLQKIHVTSCYSMR